MGIEAEWRVLQRDERPHEESGTHEQQERHGDLADDQRRPNDGARVGRPSSRVTRS